jgi:hypothetical protein
MIPAITVAARVALAYLKRHAPKLVAGAKAATSPRAWNSAIGHLTAKGAMWAIKRPFLSTALATVALYTPEISDEIEAYWTQATGGAVDSAVGAIDYAEKSPEKEALILAGFAHAGLPPGSFMTRSDGQGLTDHEQSLLAQLQQVYDMRHEKVAVAAIGFGAAGNAVPSEIEFHIKVINHVSDVFSIRSSTALTELRSAMNAFMSLSDEEIRTAHRIKQL